LRKYLYKHGKLLQVLSEGKIRVFSVFLKFIVDTSRCKQSGGLDYAYKDLYEIFCCNIKLLLLFSQMWIPLAIVLLVSTTISSISTLITNPVRTTHSAVLDTPMNNKYSTPASRLYATHRVQCEHHIPDPIIGLSPEAFALNTEFDKSSKSLTTYLFGPVVHNFDSNRESGFIVQKRSRGSFHGIAQTTVLTSVASFSETFLNVVSGVEGTSSSGELLSVYLPTDTISSPSTNSFSKYFEMTQKSDFSSESAYKMSESMRTLRWHPQFRIQTSTRSQLQTLHIRKKYLT
jgi:hypothetical protein